MAGLKPFALPFTMDARHGKLWIKPDQNERPDLHGEPSEFFFKGGSGLQCSDRTCLVSGRLAFPAAPRYGRQRLARIRRGRRASSAVSLRSDCASSYSAGASWSGFQERGCIEQLYKRGYTTAHYIDFLVKHGFNAVRLPLSAPIINNDADPHRHVVQRASVEMSTKPRTSRAPKYV